MSPTNLCQYVKLIGAKFNKSLGPREIPRTLTTIEATFDAVRAPAFSCLWPDTPTKQHKKLFLWAFPLLYSLQQLLKTFHLHFLHPHRCLQALTVCARTQATPFLFRTIMSSCKRCVEVGLVPRLPHRHYLLSLGTRLSEGPQHILV